MKTIIIKIGQTVMRMKVYLLLGLCLIAISGCISEGEETYVLEEPALKASQMIIGGWKNSSVKVVDEDGNEVPDMGVGENIPDIPEISFDEDGNYTVTHPDGTTDSGSWNISDDEEYLYLNDVSWRIFSFGKNRLVILLEYKYEERYYYIMLIFDKVSSPEEESGSMPDIGDISDNNPYKPWGQHLVSKITLNRRYTNDNTYNKEVYLFRYDAKSRIIEYTEQIYNTINNTVARENKFNFIYDDTKVYLYCNKKLMNVGVIGDNGYLTELYEGTSTEVDATFSYNQKGLLTYLNVDGQTWTPSYDYYGHYTNGSAGDQISWGWGYIDNIASIDFNGFVSTIYQIEWCMHYDYSGIVWGLFDFYGKRNNYIADEVKRGSYWTDKKTNVEGHMEGDSCVPTDIKITRTGLNDPFVADYIIEYVK